MISKAQGKQLSGKSMCKLWCREFAPAIRNGYQTPQRVAEGKAAMKRRQALPLHKASLQKRVSNASLPNSQKGDNQKFMQILFS